MLIIDQVYGFICRYVKIGSGWVGQNNPNNVRIKKSVRKKIDKNAIWRWCEPTCHCLEYVFSNTISLLVHMNSFLTQILSEIWIIFPYFW